MSVVLKMAEAISDELALHKQGLDWREEGGIIQRAAQAAIATLGASEWEIENLASGAMMLCDGYCHDGCQ